VLATPELADLLAGEADLAIRFSGAPARSKGLRVERLLGEELFPVCTKGLARGLHAPEELRTRRLLHDQVRGAHGGWSDWLRAAGVRGLSLQGGASFSDASHLVQAALAGQGVALGRRSLVEDELRRGTLVQPFATVLRSRSSYWLLWPEAQGRRAEVRAFCAFLRRAVARGSSAAPQPPPSRRRPPPAAATRGARPTRAARGLRPA
jgi:LysR family glycine cleavage system transcriptional activator